MFSRYTGPRAWAGSSSNLHKPDDLVLHQVQFALHRVRRINEDVDAVLIHFPKEDSTPSLEPLNPKREIVGT